MMKVNKEDWNDIKNTDVECYKFPISINLNKNKASKLIAGFCPVNMEDKWFVYEENSFIYMHRSWTGNFIAKIYYVILTDGIELTDIFINSDINQFKFDKTNSEMEIKELIDILFVVVEIKDAG